MNKLSQWINYVSNISKKASIYILLWAGIFLFISYVFSYNLYGVLVIYDEEIVVFSCVYIFALFITLLGMSKIMHKGKILSIIIGIIIFWTLWYIKTCNEKFCELIWILTLPMGLGFILLYFAGVYYEKWGKFLLFLLIATMIILGLWFILVSIIYLLVNG